MAESSDDASALELELDESSITVALAATSIFTSGLYPPLIGIPGTNGLVVCSPFLYASTLVVLYPLGSRMMKNGRSVSGFPALFAAASALLEK